MEVPFDDEQGMAYLRGDVNCDGSVTIADVTCLIDYLLGSEIEPFSACGADLNEDTDISIADVTALIDLLLTGDS